jgi:glutaminase
MSDKMTVGRWRALAVALVGFGLLVPAAQAQTPAEIQSALDAALAKYATLKEGKNADYIPALAKVDPNIYGIALVTTDGKVYTAGDVKSQVSIQSISKVFTLAKVIEGVRHQLDQFVVECIVNVGPVENDARDVLVGFNLQHRNYILKTPNRVSTAGAFMAAEIPSASTIRVSAGSMTPSSHKRALA